MAAVRAVVFVAAVVAAAGVASATQFVFNADGCSNQFGLALGEVGSGWRNNDPIVANPEERSEVPSSILFRPPPPMERSTYYSTNTLINTGEYHMGELVLGETGEYTFENNVDITLHTFAEAEPGYYVGGQAVDENILSGRCDMSCTLNLFEVKTAYDPAAPLAEQVAALAIEPATRAICDQDDLILPPGAYALQMNDQSHYLNSLTYYDSGRAPVVVTNKSAVPPNTLYDPTGLSAPADFRLRFGADALAECEFLRLTTGTGEAKQCLCFTTCPASIEEALENQREQEAAAAAAAAAALAEAQERITVRYDVGIAADAVGIPTESLNCLFAELSVNNTAATDALLPVMLAAWTEGWGPDAAVDIFELTYDPSSYALVVRADVTSTRASFQFARADGTLAPIPNIHPVSSPADIIYKPAHLSVEALLLEAQQCELRELSCTPALRAESANLCGPLCRTTGFYNLLAIESAPGRATANLAATKAAVDSASNGTIPTLALELRPDATVDSSLLLSLYLGAIEDPGRPLDVEIDNFLRIHDACVLEEGEDAVERDTLLPRLESRAMPLFHVGYSFSQLRMLQHDNALNRRSFERHIVDGLAGHPPVVSVDEIRFERVPRDSVRRRAVDLGQLGGLSTDLLAVSLNYTVLIPASCLDNATTQAEGCPVLAGSALLAALEAFADNLATTYTIIDPQCSDETQTTACPYGFNKACLDAVGAEVIRGSDLSADDQTRRVFNLLFSITRCGSLGEGPDGACIDPDAESLAMGCANDQANTLVAAAAAPGGSGSSSGGGFLIIIIAIVAGVILLAIILAVVVLRRRDGSRAVKKGASSERTVVSFENPIYDDPEHDPYGAGPVYDQSADGPDEGLYDEPAFNEERAAALTKANPAYDSNESLAGASDIEDSEDEMADAYLDVAPDQDE